MLEYNIYLVVVILPEVRFPPSRKGRLFGGNFIWIVIVFGRFCGAGEIFAVVNGFSIPLSEAVKNILFVVVCGVTLNSYPLNMRFKFVSFFEMYYLLLWAFCSVKNELTPFVHPLFY